MGVSFNPDPAPYRLSIEWNTLRVDKRVTCTAGYIVLPLNGVLRRIPPLETWKIN